MTQYCRDTIAAMSGYVPGEQPRDRRYIKLNTNENPYPPSPRVAAALRAFSFDRLRLYPDPMADELRDLAAEQAGLDRDWVLFGNGSDDLLTMAVRTFVDQGAALAYPDPTYSLYPVLAAIQGARTVTIPLDERFELPADAVEQAEDARLLFLARPNAPTGTAFPMVRMRAVCRDFSGVVWIDEAYADFASDTCLELVREFENVVVSRTFSKSFSLAGVRLGYAYGHPGLVSEMLKVKDSYNVNMLTQALGAAALRDRAAMEANAGRVRVTRDRVAEALRERGFEVLPSQANFLFAAPPVEASAYMNGLRENGILVRYFPGGRTGRYVRVTIGTDEDMDTFLEVTDRLVGGCG